MGGGAFRRRNLLFLGCFFPNAPMILPVRKCWSHFPTQVFFFLFLGGGEELSTLDCLDHLGTVPRELTYFSHQGGERGIWVFHFSYFFRIFVRDLAVRLRIADTHPQRKKARFWHTRPFGSKDVGTNDKRCSLFFPVTLFLTRNILTRTQLVFFHILILYIIYTRPPCSHRLCTFMAQSIWLFEPLLLDHKFVPFYLIFRKDVRHFNFFLPNLNLCCCCCCMKKQTIRATQHSFFLISLLNKHRNTWESKDENGHPRRELTPNKNQSPGIWKLILIYTTRGDDVKNRKPYKTIRIPFFTLQRKIWGAPKMELCWNQPSTHRSWCEILSQPGEGRGGAKTLQ